MNPILERLIELERVTLETTRLKAEVAELPQRMAVIETKLAGAKSQVEAVTKAIKDAETQKKRHESDIQDWQQKIIKFKEQSSAVKTNEQYRALMQEIDFAEQHIRDIEDKVLEGMEAAEGLQGRLKAAQAEFKEDEAEVEQEKSHARAVTAEDQKKLDELSAKETELRTGLEDNTLILFDRIVAKRKHAIAEARDQKCTACHVMVRPQRYNELLSGNELITCDSCGRILYVDPVHKAEATAPRKSGATERHWFYVPDGGEAGRFVQFTNSKSGCAMRSFDAASGQHLESHSQKKAMYQEAFSSLVSSAQPLHISFAPEAEEEYLPPDTLEEMQLQARIAPGTSA